MSNQERLLLGGLGSLIPSACNLLLVDFHKIETQMDFAFFAGYLVRVVVLFGLGAFLAYVHKKELNRWKIVQLGLGVPALAVSILNAGNSAQTKVAAIGPTLYATVSSLSSLSFVSEASAQEITPTESRDSDLKRFTLPKQSVLSRMWHGFSGTPRKHVWFVITDTASTADEAREKAAQLNQKISGIGAEVYRPYLDGQDYPIVVGRGLEQDDAQELAEKINKTMGNAKARVWSPLQEK
jgi:hypothetical protein